jgi:putative peptidoglycan lipid II flippase
VLAARWRSLILLAALAKALAFVREPIIASALGTRASSDAYYVAIGLPFFLYSLLGLPFSLWVTARLAGAGGATRHGQARAFFRRALGWGVAGSVLLALVLWFFSRHLVGAYASGLGGTRLNEAAALTQLGALALPALLVQAVCGGRLYAEHRFVTVYAWLALGSLVGLVGVVSLTPHYGAAGAVAAFVATWWITAAALLLLSERNPAADDLDVPTLEAEGLGSEMVYRGVMLQLFFQCSGVLVYNFASHLAAGEIAATLLAGKVIMAAYEALVLTAGVLVFPGIARLMAEGNQRAAGESVMRVLEWLIPITVAFMVLLVVSRTELVTVLYQRGAFDGRSALAVSGALLGYAPYLFGIALIEILHRVAVVGGRTGGYVVVFGSALIVNLVAGLILVPHFGVVGVASAASIGMVAGGLGLSVYAHRRLSGVEPRRVAIAVVRTMVAAVLALGAVMPLRALVSIPTSLAGQLLLLAGGGLLAGGVFASVLFLLGYRWPRLAPVRAGGPGA